MQYTEDPISLIKELKLLQQWYLNFIRGISTGDPGLSEGFWDSTTSTPVVLTEIASTRSKWLLEDNVSLTLFDRTVWAVLSMHRVMVGSVSPNYSTITDGPAPLSSDTSLSLTPALIRQYLIELGVHPDAFKELYMKNARTFKYNIISSQGPNGKQTWTAHSDAKAWLRQPDLLVRLATFVRESGMSVLLDHLRHTVKIESSDLQFTDRLQLGRIVNIPEWGNKTRSVAQLDYWTQTALTPLHDTLATFLTRIPMDGTFNQPSIIQTVKEWSSDYSTPVNSFDLTAATDRIPITIYRDVLAALFGSSTIGDAWASILTERGYLTPEGKLIYYKTGQPMGAKSSFPMLALVHHVLVQHAAHLSGISGYTEYRILGDDNTMRIQSVGDKYRAIMAHYSIGLSLQKSVTYTHDAIPAAEICKRTFVSGVEISAIPVKLIAKTVSDGSLASQLQAELTSRELIPNESFFYNFMAGLIPKDSFMSLVQLNLLPVSITGLPVVYSPPITKFSDYSNWFPGVVLKEVDIVNVMTYTMIVEQLKRLDSLLRNTAIITEAIQYKGWFVSSIAQLVDNPEPLLVAFGINYKSGMTKAEFVELLKGLPSLNFAHPVVIASVNEVTRLTSMLSALQSSDLEMVKQTRSGLLDMFRNALSDTFSDRTAAAAQQERALVLKSIGNLKRAANNAPVHDVNFSVLLTSVQRLWSVRWAIGSHVSINAVRSRVASSAVRASSDAAARLAEFSLST